MAKKSEKKSGKKDKKDKKGGAKKGTEKARRQELGEMAIFRLKREAVKAGLDQDLCREATDEEELIEQIIEAEFGDGPPKSKKGKKGKKESVVGSPPPEEDDEEEEEDGEEEDGDGGDGEEEEDEEGEDEGEDEDDDGDGESDDGDDDDEEDEKPKRTRVKKEREEKSLDEEKLDAILDGLAVIRKDVAEVKSDFDGIGKYILLIWSGMKGGMIKLAKVTGAKGMKARLEKEESSILGESEDD